MRLLIKLEAVKDQAYDPKYHDKLQGLIYNLIKEYDPNLHDRKGYKNFCYSNIYPIQDMKEGDMRNLLVSSPDPKFIYHLKNQLAKNKDLNIGDRSYRVRETKPVTPRLKSPFKIITATPVTFRIPHYMYKEYGIESDKKYKYWRKTYPFNTFIKQLEENLYKKYNQYHKTETKEEPVFEQFLYKKETCNPTIIDGKEYEIIGSIWEFSITNMTKQQKNMIEYALDTGIGERNALGYGFMNVMRGP